MKFLLCAIGFVSVASSWVIGFKVHWILGCQAIGAGITLIAGGQIIGLLVDIAIAVRTTADNSEKA